MVGAVTAISPLADLVLGHQIRKGLGRYIIGKG